MEENISKYELYILKEIEGELTPPEKKELEEWLQIPQNKIDYQEHKKLWNSLEDFRQMTTINTEKARKKVEKQLFGKMAMLHILRNLERVAAILFIPLVLSSVWYFFIRESPVITEDEIVFNTIEVPLGMRSSVTLPDGTSVCLNAGSSLKYPVPFGRNDRQVELSGEAYFDVQENKSKPFIVSTSNLNIKVLGTSFNCCAYREGDNIETALVEGKVEICGKDGKNILVMKPGELATFYKENNSLDIKETNLDKYIAWKSGKLLFRDDPMEKVLEKLGRWYNVEFQVDNKEILEYIYSATFTGESLDQMLKMFSLSAPIQYKLVKRNKLNDNAYEKQIIKLTTKPRKGN